MSGKGSLQDKFRNYGAAQHGEPVFAGSGRHHCSFDAMLLPGTHQVQSNRDRWNCRGKGAAAERAGHTSQSYERVQAISSKPSPKQVSQQKTMLLHRSRTPFRFT